MPYKKLKSKKYKGSPKKKRVKKARKREMATAPTYCTHSQL